MSRDEDTDGKKLFIGGLSYDTCKEDLKAAFGRFGDITDIHIPIDRDTDKPRGFGFITFADSRDAKEAVAEMHEKELSGRHVSVNLARPRGEGGGRSGGGYGGSGGSRSSGGGFRDSGRDRGDRGSYDKYGGYIGGRSGDRGGDRGDRGDRSYLR